MNKQDKTPEEIQKRYSELMKQASMQFFLIPILVIILIISTIIDSQIIFSICMLPIALYMLWFRLIVYRCPKCGHLFNRYQIYTYECKNCNTRYGRK